MKKLEAYINKIGIPADAYRLKNVGSNYFYNISCHYSAIEVIFDYTTYDARDLEKQRKQLEKYCSRYNYTIYNRGAVPGMNYFSIMKAADREALENYFRFESWSREEVEKIIHDFTISGRRSSEPATLEKLIKEVMQEHENNYRSYLEAIA